MKLLFLLFSLLTFDAGKVTLHNYCNKRFGYCFQYPSYLQPQPESENGDGRIFTNEAGDKILTVYGIRNLDPEGHTILIKTQYDIDSKEMLAEKATITYKKLGKTFYVLSGIKDGNIFYQKLIVKKDAFCYAIVSYKTDDNNKYANMTSLISNSFK